MPTYTVDWTIELEAENAEDAARLAWFFLRKSDSAANHFTVADEMGEREEIDLQAIAERDEDQRANVRAALSLDDTLCPADRALLAGLAI